jgi:hypothetical protein
MKQQTLWGCLGQGTPEQQKPVPDSPLFKCELCGHKCGSGGRFGNPHEDARPSCPRCAARVRASSRPD